MRVFHKLLLNFDWWVNRKDELGNNIFQGGFLGLDNIGVFDRNTPLPPGWVLGQADGTSWMAMYCLNLLGMALELAIDDPAYEDVASKFWEHFVYIAHAMHHMGDDTQPLGRAGRLLLRRDPPAGRPARADPHPLARRADPALRGRHRRPELLDRFPGFKRRMQWFIENRPDLIGLLRLDDEARRRRADPLRVATPDQLRASSRYMLDENEFLSPYGIRSVSRHHLDHPYVVNTGGVDPPPGLRARRVDDRALRRQLELARPDLVPDQLPDPGVAPALPPVLRRRLPGRVPDRLGTDDDAAGSVEELARRLSRIFLPDATGDGPSSRIEIYRTDPHWKDLVLFHEYFHGDTGKGLGARTRRDGRAWSPSSSTSSATRRRRCYGADPPLAAGEIRAGVDHAPMRGARLR